ncbi:MAG: hypothetical protein ACRDNF_11775 [Streptosporangiaceae bacterium]
MSGPRLHRQAALPPGGAVRPRSLDDSGLVVTVFAESGDAVETVADFSGLPGSIGLRRELAAAFDRRSGPGGGWRAAATCELRFAAARSFLAYCASLDHPPETVAEISAGLWNTWRIGLGTGPGAHNTHLAVRRLLSAADGLPAGTLQALTRKVGKPAQASVVASYSREEYEQIRSAAAVIFNTALVRVRASLGHLRRWQAGEFAAGSGEHRLGKILEVLSRTGEVPGYRYQRRARTKVVLTDADARLLGGRDAQATWQRLFLDSTEIFALTVLLIASEGWNVSVIDRMTVPGYDPAAADPDVTIHRMEIYKRRRPPARRYSSSNLLDAGPGTAGRLMSQAIEATGPARAALAALGCPSDRLLASHRTRRHRSDEGWFRLGVPVAFAQTRPGGPDGMELRQPDGRPLRVSLQRLRRTVQVLIRREPAQNSPATHEQIYIGRDTATIAASRATITEGLTGALGHAQSLAAMRARFDDDTIAGFTGDQTGEQAVTAGRCDTVLGACLDFHAGPFGEPGHPCRVSFLLCLACPNAVATRRHLPRQVHLHRCLDELRGQLDPAAWTADWAGHFARLCALLDDNTTPAMREAARHEVTEADRQLIGSLLRGGLDL